MKRLLSIILTLTMLLSVICIPASAKGYRDVTTADWFCDPVTQVTEHGYMSGVGNELFSPYESINRAMLVQVLYKISGESVSFTSYFTDVKENHWFAEAVSWAKENDVASGTSDTLFSPYAKLTREQLATFYARFAEKYSLELAEKEGVEYPDISRVSPWALDSVEMMNNSAVISTRTANYFLPKATVSRAELAASLLRLMGDYENGVYDDSVHVELIYTDANSLTLEPGGSYALTTTVWPEEAIDKTVSYSSSDPSVATVDGEGRIVAQKKGVAYITVTSRDDGYTSVCRVEVRDFIPFAPIIATNISYNNDRELEMKPIPEKVPSTPGSDRYIDPNKPMVAITYDDGPNPTNTNRILDCLVKYDARATFFELGYLAQAYPDCIRRIVNTGNEIANHSWDHPNLANLSASGVSSQISRTSNTIYDICGVRPRLVRPPYGSVNSTVRNNAGAPLILWSIDTLDWKYRDASYVTSVIKNEVTDGSIILMHSIYSSTAAATEAIVPWLISKGYQLVTVSEMAKARGIDMKNGSSYFAFYD